jgi:predicted regulator of Ras-like GTPase activity (Roadblock/LC7/MglB family)
MWDGKALSEALNRVLSMLIKADHAIRTVIIVDRSGLTLGHVTKFDAKPIDVDGLGAIGNAVFCASETQGKYTEIEGKLDLVVSEFDTGVIFTAGVDTLAVLCVIADPTVNIGVVRFAIKRNMKHLVRALKGFHADETTEKKESIRAEERLLKLLKELNDF